LAFILIEFGNGEPANMIVNVFIGKALIPTHQSSDLVLSMLMLKGW